MSKKATSFNHMVHHRDPKSGQVKTVSAYRKYVRKDGSGSPSTFYERGGEFFAADGSPLPGDPRIVVETKKTETKPSQSAAKPA